MRMILNLPSALAALRFLSSLMRGGLYWQCSTLCLATVCTRNSNICSPLQMETKIIQKCHLFHTFTIWSILYAKVIQLSRFWLKFTDCKAQKKERYRPVQRTQGSYLLFGVVTRLVVVSNLYSRSRRAAFWPAISVLHLHFSQQSQ